MKLHKKISLFLEGIGSIFDTRTLKSRKIIKDFHSKSDFELLASDWQNIGKDIDVSLKNYGQIYRG